MDCCETEPKTRGAGRTTEPQGPPSQRWHLLFAVVPIAAALVVAFVALRPTNGRSGLETAKSAVAGTAQATSGDVVTDEGQGAVEVSARLERSKSTDARVVFTVSLNTHSVDLSSFDPIAQVRLRAGSQEIQGAFIEDPGNQPSHHQQFLLSFARPEARQVVLAVRNVAGVAERQLRFTL